jgi:diguanylate cyclase (GGDEF)-like protein
MRIESRLSDVLSEFARTLVTDFPIQGILDHLVKRIVDVLPIGAAGVTLISPTTEPRFIAASDESAMRFERLQTELGEGPCLAAYRTGTAIAVPDLEHDVRFPGFAQRALSLGLEAVFTFPLRDGDRRLGALDLYRDSPGALDDQAMAAAQTLADVATAYLLNAQIRVDLEAASARARDAAMHDPLTGLPNRTMLMQRLEHAVARNDRTGKLVGALYVDLDGFKEVNDNLGHHAGDQLLAAVAHRTAAVLRNSDTLARIAGDEFVVLCEDLEDEAQATLVASRIVEALTEPFRLSSYEVSLSASVGIAFAVTNQSRPSDRLPRQRSDVSSSGTRVGEQLLREADTAMYQVKKRGGGHHAVLDLRQLDLAQQRATLSRGVRRALRRDEMRVEFQPIVAAATGRVLGAEALLRWTHPTLGAVAPSDFIPLAEETGSIADLGRFVLLQACLERQTWGAAGRGLGVAVNVSPRQLTTSGFIETVAQVLADTGTPPELVTLEVTEGALGQDRPRALVALEQLKGLGVMLALDDFGTGSSSLSDLREGPVDIVKIDRAFVAELQPGATSRHIVEAVVTLAHRLDMLVVAEGVETSEQHAAVLGLGCDSYQGYLFSPAVSSQAFAALIDRSNLSAS